MPTISDAGRTYTFQLRRGVHYSTGQRVRASDFRYAVERQFLPGALSRGFDGAFQQEYFPDSHVKSNFLCNLGYGDPAGLFPRSPRLDFDEACKLL